MTDRNRKPARHAAEAARSAATAEAGEAIDGFRARHLELARREVMTAAGLSKVTVNDGESPLAWLARRKGRDGRAMITPTQFIAGEKLRADFTRGQLTPRVTSNWDAPSGRQRAAGGGGGEMTDVVIASRQRLRAALQACGPEFAGLLMDVCCFLRGLEEVESQRGWPSRSAKVVLQLALDRLARHYGLDDQATGAAAARLRSWMADDAGFSAG
ncbi:DUF6456 domain-containing protein [Rhodopseudomonas palustris]|uniref:DUF6456 domain-containing protein n=1 Tax=Rhodopseudomonas palustris (strain BisB18) TaxID=316056 RepID=Q217V1_RHOPB